MRSVIFCDIDNCIADDGWRRKLIDFRQASLTQRYHEYHRASLADLPAYIEALVECINTAEKQTGSKPSVVFLTARPEGYRDITLQWLHKNFDANGDFSLLMRPANDSRPSPHFKVETAQGWLFEEHLNPDNVFAVIDDREDVLDAFRNNPQFADVHMMRWYINEHHAEVDVGFVLLRQFSSGWGASLVSGGAGRAAGSGRGNPVGVAHIDCVLPQQSESTSDVLREMAETFDQRNAVYKDNYKTAGAILRAMYPQGIAQHLMGDELHLLMLIAVKLSRFVHAEHKHKDSMVDVGVYAAMIANITDGEKQ
jgi:hypothetical protein